ncbi:MAG: hypothetical protein EPN79_15675 [Burkholderiaceae bacterium]|nr:MAG: hypothetical protein EPN79_15675 [Burkholderiaceae bacterium]
MNAVLKPEPSSESTSTKITAVGRTWGRLFGVAESDIETFAAAYQQRIEAPTVWWVRGSLNGQEAVIARLGAAHVLSTPTGIRVVDEAEQSALRGRLTLVTARSRWLKTGSFTPKRRSLWPLDRHRTGTEFAASAAAITERATHPDHPTRILLTSFSGWARDLAKRLAYDDLEHAFCSVMSPSGMQQELRYRDHIKGRRAYDALRPKFYLGMIGSALRELRSVLPVEVRKTLWSIGVPDVRLANWLLETEVHRLYRIQALKAQPLLLPTALLGPCHQHEHCQGMLALRSLTQRPDHVDDEDMRVIHELEHSIDEGRPWFDLLARVLAIPGVRQSSGYHAAQVRIDTAHVRWLASRSTAFLRWTRHPGAQDVAHYLTIAMILPGNRMPSTKSQWPPFVEFVAALHLPKTELLPASFLKGMPCSWTDPAWSDATKRLSLVFDAIEWAAGQPSYMRDESTVRWFVRHTTLRQLLNFSEAAHALREEVVTAMRREYPATARASISWEPCLLSGPFKHGTLTVVELTSAGQLQEEGAQLSHCVADYEGLCVTGSSRIFSVRDSSGRPLSTIELQQEHDIHSGERRLMVRQHFGFKNRRPAIEAEKTLEAFLHAAKKEQIHLSLSWPHDVHPADLMRSEQQRRIAVSVGKEIERRWPNCPIQAQAVA